MAYDWETGLSGAATGAGYGSSFGPLGLGIGAVGGALTGFLGGKKKKKKKMRSRLDPQQQRLYNDLMGGLYGEGPMSSLYNFDAGQANKIFDELYSRPAYRAYEENIVPKITGQFRSRNLQNSSYAGESLTRAGRDLQEQLNAERMRYLYEGEQGAQQRKASEIDKLLNRTTFDYEQPESSTIDRILQQIGPEGAKILADLISNYSQKNMGYTSNQG